MQSIETRLSALERRNGMLASPEDHVILVCDLHDEPGKLLRTSYEGATYTQRMDESRDQFTDRLEAIMLAGTTRIAYVEQIDSSTLESTP